MPFENRVFGAFALLVKEPKTSSFFAELFLKKAPSPFSSVG